MQKVLLVGATGQLGASILRKLLDQRVSVRALVRSQEAAERFRTMGVDAVLGDLSDAASLRAACRSMEVIISTANAAMPTRKRDSFEAVERDGYRNLIAAATQARIQRFVYTSAVPSRHTHLSPFLRYKRETEVRLAASGLNHVSFQAPAFMDTTFAMMGSQLPLRGSENAIVSRPFPFAQNHWARVQNSIERDHLAIIPGDGTSRQAFICIDDVARYHVAAAFSGPSGDHLIGGPEALTFLDIVALYERLLGLKLRVRKAPAAVFRIAATLLRPFNSAAANLMCLNYIAATDETFPNPAAAAAFGITLTSADTFMSTKLALSAGV